MKPLENSAVCPKCGGGHKSKPFCIYDNGWHCFACGYTKSSDRSFSVKNNVYQYSNVTLPECTNNVSEYSIDALEWLAKFNITEELIYKHKILFCKEDGSLLFLNIKNDVLIGYQRRRMRARFITTAGEKIPYLFESNNNALIIVEDYISAIRTSCLYDSVCLWGVKINYTELYNYLLQYNIIYIWLDNDTEKPTNSGQEAANKIIEDANKIVNRINYRRGYSKQTKIIRNIVSEKDPKYYLNSEISRYIMECN
jgi:hypothetical protein